jgi:hypothetical protein
MKTTINELQNEVIKMKRTIRAALLDNYILYNLNEIGEGGEKIQALLKQWDVEVQPAVEKARVARADIAKAHATAKDIKSSIVRLAVANSRRK